MEKTDFKKKFKQFYKPSAKHAEIIQVPKFQFLQIDGIGASRRSPDFQAAIEALFGLSYKIKFASKQIFNSTFGS